ncbi:MAG: AAA family ATPase [Candidatus Thalassarchaeaceae archaeon]|jgi:dephospho-CoA kinase|nr:AAA family ATPase [Candidatus Thalassarchaeaceae archaeon]
MWFGLTGRNASGKTTVVEWLKKHGYKATSCSDSIRSWLHEEGEEITRENLIQGGRTLREMGGAGILAEMLRDSNSDEKKLVIDSIRTPAEVEALRQRVEFQLIEVRASREVRWERLQSRARPGDPETYELFVEQEEAELIAVNTSGQALDATAKMADIVINNNGISDELDRALENLLKPDES